MQNQPANLRAAEKGQQTQPAYLYIFDHAGTKYWLTNLDADVTVAGLPGTLGSDPQTFTAAQVAHDTPEQSAELSSRQATVTVAVLDEEFRKYFVTAVAKKVKVRVYRVNSASLPGPLDYATDCYMEFSGIAITPRFNDTAISIGFISEILQDDRPVLRFNYQAQCNHVLYGKGCFVNAAAHMKTTTISAANRSNRSIDVPIDTMPNGAGQQVAVTAKTFEAGYVYEAATGNYIGIVASEVLSPTLVRLYLQWWPPTLGEGATVDCAKGCQHTIEACKADFDNLNGQEGIVTGLTQTGADVIGTIPGEWVALANKVPKRLKVDKDGTPLADNEWVVNEDVGGTNHGPFIIVLLNTGLPPAGSVKLSRIGGFGGHPFIPTKNPAIDGI